MITVIIHGTAGCQACHITETLIQRTGTNLKTQQINETTRLHARAQGFTQLPYVQVFSKNGDLLDEWAGFRRNKINQWAGNAKC